MPLIRLAVMLTVSLILAALGVKAQPAWKVCECRRPLPNFLRRSSALR